MQELKMIKYNTMNSWNRSTAPAFNLKVYNVIDRELQEKVFELMDCEGFYDDINFLIQDFDIEHDYKWQAGFNGRSGGYLVLYTGERKTKIITREDFKTDNGYGGRVYISDRVGWKSCEEFFGNSDKTEKEVTVSVGCFAGKGLEVSDVPDDVLVSFNNLARDIVTFVEDRAKACEVVEETYTVEKTRKVIREKE